MQSRTQITMKRWAILLLVIIAVAACLPVLYHQLDSGEAEADVFYFGVSFGQETAEEALPLIDKVKNYTNIFFINSWNITANQTALNLVCDYAANANLSFIVYFDFISRMAFPWHQQWLDTAHERWGDKFLGVHLRDEPGGKQVEENDLFTNASDYADAANKYINAIGSYNSTIDAKSKGIKLFTSDFMLYWWDYLAGYDTVFAELGWNISTNRQIALCRGAANMQSKDWGAIITWEKDSPPYLANADVIYADMVAAYRAGAKYVLLFNYPVYPEGNPYGVLSDEHFEVMQSFWQYVNTNLRDSDNQVDGSVVLVLPQNYGWGMRRSDYITMDRIWGLWDEDENSKSVLESVNFLVEKYGLELDIIYEDSRFSYSSKYAKVYFWNSTLS